ncbi:lipopolysaccharide biosynthesis protein [Vibrio hippocampi]|uniref:Lipopolysaccharide biosynthesis protein n=1 Tax=Vibrio hippocampi TaxID=654686 RepID=A0ABM8ZN13_9VIBR|nr:hypothetical protein [Vibrio hippocampi]CAH0529966.1 hypothetical protein VHP8226_03692 [Vibrio hippocampi]
MNKPLASIAAYGISLVLTRGITLFMLPFITHYLTPTELGKLELLASFGALLGVAVSLCLHESLYRYAGVHTCQRKQFIVANRIMSLSCLFAVLAIVPIIGILLPLATQLDIDTRSILLVCGNLVLTGPLMISTAWLRMQDKVIPFALVSIGATVIQVVIIVVSLMSSATINAILSASLIATLFQLTAFQSINGFFWRRFRVTQCKRYLTYALPLVLSGVVAFGVNGAEKWVLALGASVEQLALYAIAAKFALALCLLIQPFGMWWMPKRFACLKADRQQTTNTTELGLLFACLLAIGLCFSVPIFIEYALDDQYHSANQLLGVVLLIALCKEFGELLNLGLLAQKRTQWLLMINIATALSSILLALLLINISTLAMLYGMLAVAVARLCVVGYLSQRCVRLPYRTVYLVCLFTFTAALLLTSPQVDSLFWRLSLILLAPVCLILFAQQFRSLRDDIGLSINKGSH